MRVFASRNLGHGVRVGVSQSVGWSRRPVPRTRGGDPVINGKVVKAPPVYRWLLLVICVSGGVGLVVFPPILVVTGVAFVFLLAAQHRWTKAQKVAAQDHRPPSRDVGASGLRRARRPHCRTRQGKGDR